MRKVLNRNVIVRSAAVLVFLLLVLPFLAACGGESNEPEDTNTAASGCATLTLESPTGNSLTVDVSLRAFAPGTDTYTFMAQDNVTDRDIIKLTGIVQAQPDGTYTGDGQMTHKSQRAGASALAYKVTGYEARTNC